MGCDPSTLTRSVAIDERRTLFESVWNAPLPRSKGYNLLSMMDEAEAGRLKALWIIGYDVLPTLANEAATRRAFRSLEFVAVQDLFITKTAKVAANIFLPAASVFERDGTFMNAERRIQRVRKAVAPPGEACTDWQIICALDDRMGHGAHFRYGSSEDIWNEIRQVWPEGAGMSYERLNRQGLQYGPVVPKTIPVRRSCMGRNLDTPRAHRCGGSYTNRHRNTFLMNIRCCFRRVGISTNSTLEP